MTKRDAVMFALYGAAIDMGVQMMDSPATETLGFLQILLCSALFGLRMYTISKRTTRS